MRTALCSLLLCCAVCLLSATLAQAMSTHEESRINAMISALEKRSDIVFIRNGTEHSAAEAAAHLRLKLGNTRKRLQTAEEFIDKVAFSSSMSGKPYFIKQTGREPQTANGFLHELLQQANQ